MFLWCYPFPKTLKSLGYAISVLLWTMPCKHLTGEHICLKVVFYCFYSPCLCFPFFFFFLHWHLVCQRPDEDWGQRVKDQQSRVTGDPNLQITESSRNVTRCGSLALLPSRPSDELVGRSWSAGQLQPEAHTCRFLPQLSRPWRSRCLCLRWRRQGTEGACCFSFPLLCSWTQAESSNFKLHNLTI